MCIHGREIKTHTPKNHRNNTQPKFAFDNLLSPEKKKQRKAFTFLRFDKRTKDSRWMDGTAMEMHF